MDSRTTMAGVLLLAAGLGGCGSCGADDPTGYARCYEAEPPWTGARRVGGVEIEIEDRAATWRGASLPFRIGVLRGSAPHPGDLAPALRLLRARSPMALIVLGDLGDDAASAEASIAALGRFGRLVFVLGGGRDQANDLDAALGGIEGESPVIDARGLRALRLGRRVVLFLSGAPGPRYARNEKACAFDDDALSALAEEMTQVDSARGTLFAWASPRFPDGPLGIAGEPSGDPGLASWLSEMTQIDSVVSAWPTGSAFRPFASEAVRPRFRMTVGPAAGPGRLGDDDTAISPAAAVVEIRENGAALVEVLSVPVASSTP